ncbi:MAG TPA: VCBS repeat-containing protein [Pirellulaceae bacterium]|nr:VCBS repeat-containing protein [Pirellulaceae bacterium]HMO91156.1 VCBS repeat-containing protein [Pirellulaceae bacterium]HMP69074.1 VCBS repeat-containing protein [Pirellulaceae bacterium]
MSRKKQHNSRLSNSGKTKIVSSQGTLKGSKDRASGVKPLRRSNPFSNFTYFTIGILTIALVSLFGYFVIFSDSQSQHVGAGGSSELTATNDLVSAANSSSVSPNRSSESRDTEIEMVKKVSWDELDDPTADGWDTEVFSEQVDAKLKSLGKVLSHPGIDEFTPIEGFIDVDFVCSELLPSGLKEVFVDQALVVARSADHHAPVPLRQYQGYTGLVDAINQFWQPWNEASDIRFKFKLFRVEPQQTDAHEVITKQYLAVIGSTPSGMMEQNSTWTMRWKTVDPQSETPTIKLLSIEVHDFEQAQTRSTDLPLFVDVTEHVLGSNRSYHEQLLHGYNYWLDRTETRPYWEQLGTPGVAVGDVNGDGLDDVYLCQERGLPNLLFIQNPDGTLRDVSQEAGVDWLEDSRSALFVDLNNNGIQDLVVAVTGGLVIAENDGTGKFTVQNVLKTTDDIKSVCAADYDLDGRLDIYAVAYNASVFEQGVVEDTRLAVSLTSETIYDMNNGGRNLLFRNECETGRWAFREVTTEVGLDVHNRRLSLAASWEDFDNDGDLDLYVANDYGLNCLYRNDGGTFVEIGVASGADDKNFSMASTWADINRNGWMDLYIANMFSGAGNRTTVQQQFKPGISDEERSRFERLARGNTLLLNKGDGSFDDITLKAAVNVGRWAWSSNFVDLNNDGWKDIVVANGMITTEDTGDC